MDKELKAMGSILKTLSEFDGETRGRIWAWIDNKLQELPGTIPKNDESQSHEVAAN